MWAILDNRSLYAESHYKKFWLRKAEMELNMLTNPNPNPNSSPLANPNPNPIPNPNSNRNLNPNPNSNPNPNPIPNPNLSLHPNPNHNPNPSTIPDPNPNPNSNPNLNLKPNPNPNPNSNTNPDFNPGPNQNPDPNPNHNPSPYPNPKPNPNLNPDYNPNPDHNLNSIPNRNPNPNPNLNSNPNHNPGSIPNPSPNPDHNLSPHPNPSPNLNTSPNPKPNHSPNPNPNTDPNPSPNPNTSTSADSDPRLRNIFCVPPTNGDLDKVALCCPPPSAEMWSRFPLGVDQVSSSQIFGKEEEENPLCIISQAPDLVESAPVPTPCQICAICGTNKTPMWRTGPDGHKTLCNACGIRYKKLKSKSSLRLEQKVDGQHSPKHIPSIAKRKIESQRVGPQLVRSPKRAKLSDLANRATKSMLGKSRTLGASLKNDILYPFAKDEEEGAVLLMALSSSSFA